VAHTDNTGNGEPRVGCSRWPATAIPDRWPSFARERGEQNSAYGSARAPGAPPMDAGGSAL